MKRVPIRNLIFAASLAASPCAYAVTTFLSVDLADPTTLRLGNSQRDITVKNLSFDAGLAPHYTGDGAVIDQNGFNFSISALETGTMTYLPGCSGRGCRPAPRSPGTWTQGNYDPFTNSYSPIRSISVDMFAPGDVLDATFNFVIPGGATASSPFSFSFLVTDYFLLGPYTLKLTDTTKGSVITPTGGTYSLDPDSYALKFVAAYGSSGSMANIITTAPTVAAVPLPATYTMMLSGLGLLGVMARRRDNYIVFRT